MISKTLELNKKKKRISNSKKFSIISYGCQMNVSDSEVVASILESIGYSYSDDINNSELVLLNTCSIREKAEQTVRKKLESINACLLYTSPSPRDATLSRMPSSA